MFYIKLDNNLDLVITVKDTLRRGDNLSKKVIYLVPFELGEIDPLTATFYLSYIRADGVADVVILERLEEKYNESYYQYTFPISNKLTKYPGEIITWMQIYDGDIKNPKIAKSGECILQIQESVSMDAYLPDLLMTAFHQLKQSTDEGFEEANANIGSNAEAIGQNAEAISQNAEAIAQNSEAIAQNADAIRSNIETINENSAAISELYMLVAEKADGLIFDKEENILQLTSNGTPIGNKVVLNAVTGVLISSVSLTTDGELVIFFSDGTFTNVGKVVGEDGKVYVPHIDARKILTFTIEDMAGEIPDPVDLNLWDEWQDMDESDGQTDYVWEDM